MKDLKNLKGAKMISKMEQRAIKGGWTEEGKPELCGDLVSFGCYYPTHCVTAPDGTMSCV